MSDGMGREFTYLSSHATNRYFIPNWGIFLKETRHSSHCNLTCCRSARYSVMSCRPNSSHNMETADCVTSWKVNSSHRNALNVKLLHADVTRDEFL